MKQTVFRKVMVKDRLPVSFGIYNTNRGSCTWLNGLKMWEWGNGALCYPEWWLESIELPSEDDVYTLSSRCATTERMNGFEEGANYILNKLK